MTTRRTTIFFRGPRARSQSGIALFILLTSLIVISLGMSELIQSSNMQASRVRNFGDRLEAIYIARSTQNLARAILILDANQKKFSSGDGKAQTGAPDTPQDLWAQPIPFPIPSSVIQLMAQKAMGEGESQMSNTEKDEMKAFYKKCDNFFADFRGEADAKIEDFSSLLYLNSLEDANAGPPTYNVLLNLLKPNYDFERSLSARNINSEEVARQIRDYIDRNDFEDDTKSTEISPYLSAQLEYSAKNQPILLIDELKLIPEMDDELYDYLTHYVAGAYFKNGTRRQYGQLNLNTISKNLFQALLKNVSNPEQVAADFEKHRKEKKFVYTDANIKSGALKDNIGIDDQNIYTILLTGSSDAFKIVTDVTVNQVKLRVEANLTRPVGSTKSDPLTMIRVSP